MRLISNLITISFLYSAFFVGCNKQEKLVPLRQGQIAPPPETVKFEITDYVPATGKEYKDLFVRNFSVIAKGGKLSLSSSRDGLADATKIALSDRYGFFVNTPVSNSNGFSDLLFYLTGIDAIKQANMYCAPNARISSSNDAFMFLDHRLGGMQQFLGLKDCEKQYLNMNPSSFDYDGDGIPDYLEMQCGLNPKNSVDVRSIAAGDALTSFDKCKQGIPVDESSDSQPNQLFAYHYATKQKPGGARDFVISNVPVLNGGADNFIAFYLVETDTGTGAASLRTAFIVLPDKSANSVIRFEYWNRDGNHASNQEVIVQ